MQDGALALSESSKAGLLGFYNPCLSAEDSVADALSGSTKASKPSAKPLLYVSLLFYEICRQYPYLTLLQQVCPLRVRWECVRGDV